MKSRRRKATEGGLSCGAAQRHRTYAFERGAEGAPLCTWEDDLGRELRESPMPDHRPDHFESVRRRLRATGEDGAGGLAAAPQAPATAQRPHGKPARRARRGRTMRLAAVASVAAAAVAAVAMTWAGVPGLEKSKPPVATADTVLARVEHALASLSSISGDVLEYGTVRGRPFARRVGSFTLTSDGDYRIVQREQGVAYTYDSRSRVARRCVLQDGRVLYGEIARDLPDPGPFFGPWMGASQVLERSVAAYARAVIADLDPNVPVTPVTYEGRTAWSITVREQLAGGSNGRWARIVVDAASGYPLVVEHWMTPDEVSGTRIENLRVGGPVPRDQFTIDLKKEATLLPMSERFRRVTLPAAAALCRGATRGHGAAFVPYVPSWLPKGYKLSGITAAVNGAYMGSVAPAEPGEIGSVTVVLTYRRGFDRFCVVNRWRLHNPPGSDDPFDEDSVSRPALSDVPLTYGALRGEMAHVVLGLPDWPHLFVTTGAGDRVTVSVAGDLTRSELVLVADALRAVRR